MPTTTSYEDLIVRNSTSDTGQIPAVGSLSSSPDIIPAGRTPVNDPSAFLADMTKDYGQNIGMSEDNYIYVRGVNLLNAQQQGTVHMYQSPSSLLQYPSQWSQREIALDTGAYGSPVEAASRANFVTKAPFVWRNVPPPPSGDHYCLIGRLVTVAHPNPIPNTFQLPNFAAWVASNRGMSWRNVSVVTDPSAPTLSEPVLYEQGETEELVLLVLTCSGIPEKCDVAFQCATPGPNPLISFPRTKVVPTGALGLYTTIPADFKSYITYEFWSNGATLPDQTSITLEAIYVVPPSPPQSPPNGEAAVELSTLGALAFDLSELEARFEGVSAVSGASEPVKPQLGIRVGSFSSVFRAK